MPEAISWVLIINCCSGNGSNEVYYYGCVYCYTIFTSYDLLPGACVAYNCHGSGCGGLHMCVKFHCLMY